LTTTGNSAELFIAKNSDFSSLSTITQRNMRQNTAEPAAVLAGGERSVVVVSSAALLRFFCMKGATALRAVSSELRDAIAAFAWINEMTLRIHGRHIMQWRICFPLSGAVLDHRHGVVRVQYSLVAPAVVEHALCGHCLSVHPT